MHLVCILGIYLSIYLFITVHTVDLGSLQTVLERTRGCTWRQHSSTLGDGDRVNSEVYLQMVLSALGDGDRAKLEMHLEAVIERTWG